MKMELLCAAIAATGALFAEPKVYEVDSVESLTNVLFNLPDVPDDYVGSRIEIAPGTYDLSGVYMNGDSHLYVKHMRNFLITGTGDGPEKTVLLGGGKAGGHRVLELYGGGNYWWTTVSNLTITGGYHAYKGGAAAYAQSVATLYVDCIISNNVSDAGGQDWVGGAIKNGCARRTYFANNSAKLAAGAIDCGAYKESIHLQPYTDSCYFTNNVQTAGSGGNYYGGAVAGGYHTNCVFVGNSAVCGGAGGRSNIGGLPVFVDCRFYNNKSSGYGGALCRPGALTNCVFVGNTGNGGAIFAQHNWGDEFSAYRCFFTNNVSASSYGGAVRGNGGFVKCEFFGNKSAYGGGAFGQLSATKGKVVLSGCTFISNTVTHVNNTYDRCGGAVYLSGGNIEDCSFVDNLQTNASGAAIALVGPTGDFSVSGCTFIGNKGKHDSGVLYGNNRQTISNCVFTGAMTGYHGVIARNMHLIDCIVSNTTSSGWLFYDCDLTRCSIVSNVFNALTLDDTENPGAYTNINCVFFGNEYVDGLLHFSRNKVFVNCTIAGNNATSAGNYGTILTGCTAYNSLFFSNTVKGLPCDLRTKVLGADVPFSMSNCIFTALDSDVTSPGFENCRLVSPSKTRCEWKDGRLVLSRRSCAKDCADESQWVLNAIGSADVNGGERVFGRGLDIGAVECQEVSPGLTLLVR